MPFESGSETPSTDIHVNERLTGINPVENARFEALFALHEAGRLNMTRTYLDADSTGFTPVSIDLNGVLTAPVGP